MEQANLGARVGDLLHGMVNQSGETASLSVLDGKEAVIIRRAETEHLLRADLRVGARLGLATTASGIVLAAHAPEGLVERLRQQNIPLPDDKLVAAVRARGFATNERSHDKTVKAVAAAVIDGFGHGIAAVALSGPTTRFDLEKCAKIVTAAARQISLQLGGTD
jgi:DNA-binding IclR family transcriptional regulator